MKQVISVDQDHLQFLEHAKFYRTNIKLHKITDVENNSREVHDATFYKIKTSHRFPET